MTAGGQTPGPGARGPEQLPGRLFPLDRGRAVPVVADLPAIFGQEGPDSVGFGEIACLFGGNPLLVLVATFIYFGASSEASGTRLHSFASHLRARDAMLTRLGVLGPEAVLSDAVDLLTHSTQHDIPVLDAVGKPVGLLTRDALARALHSHGGDYSVIEAMLPGLPTLGGEAPLERALAHLETGAAAVAVVDRSGALIGLVTAESLGHLLLLSRQNAR